MRIHDSRGARGRRVHVARRASVAPRRSAVTLALVLIALAPAASTQSPQGIGMAERGLAGSGVVVHEQQWARTLVRALALDEVLPDAPDPADVFALLCADAAEMTTDADGRRAPARAAFRISRETTEARAPGEPVRVVLDVPATALYQLAVEGTGKQRWSVDQRPVGHLDATPVGAAFGPRVIPLREGPHEFAGYMGRASRVDRVEVTAYRPLCIAPAGGWRADRPLTVGAYARTLVRALGLERYLPEGRSVVVIEGERFVSASEWGGRTNETPGTAPARGRVEWARAGASPAQFDYALRLPEPGVVRMTARVTSGTQQLWSIDGRYRARVDAPSASEEFAWTHVMTTHLAAGDHVIRVRVPPGAGIDRIRVVKLRAADPDYVEVLEQMGFPGGATRALVTRSIVFDSLVHPAFQELAAGFLERVAGNPAEAPLVALDDTFPPLYSRPLSPLLPSEL